MYKRRERHKSKSSKEKQVCIGQATSQDHTMNLAQLHEREKTKYIPQNACVYSSLALLISEIQYNFPE